MGLYKEETQGGVPITYHRIYSLLHIVGHQTIIVVKSYPSLESRIAEKDPDTGMGIWSYQKQYDLPYTASMNISAAYDWLKQQERFQDAEDVFE
jgi:hypothetical protein